jgi:hypothetical protein
MRHVYLIELVLDDDYDEDEKGALRVAPKPTADDVANAMDLKLGIEGYGWSIDQCRVVADWEVTDEHVSEARRVVPKGVEVVWPEES